MDGNQSDRGACRCGPELCGDGRRGGHQGPGFNALKEAYLELVPQFERSTEHKVTTTWAGTATS